MEHVAVLVSCFNGRLTSARPPQAVPSDSHGIQNLGTSGTISEFGYRSELLRITTIAGYARGFLLILKDEVSALEIR